MKKFYFLMLLVVLAIISIIVFRFVIGGPEDNWICDNGEWVKHGMPSGPAPVEPCGEGRLIGGDKDEHGCLIGAGYLWCPSTEKCQRMWEEYCEEYKEQFRGEIMDCQTFEPDGCPEECVVCPPCPACSSISCQSEEFCEEMGINRNWYENIKEKLGEIKEINSFEDCVSAGNQIMKSNPPQCMANGITFVQIINNDKSDLIRLDEPQPDEKIESPLKIKGEARGNWFFEASFPIILTNWDGLIIAEGVATANPPAGGDWMTEDFVPFEAELEFTADTSVSNRGALILKKDNPSGLPEHDDALEITVFFK